MEKQSINDLPEELILKIFSSLPMFNETVATHLLSKRWEAPWKLVPDVMFDDGSYDNVVTCMKFFYGSLLFNNAQTLERFHLKLSRKYSASDINFWVYVAVTRSVRKLRINLSGKTLELPRCLTTCVTLKSLILTELNINVVPTWFFLPSLQSLHLFSVNFSGESFASILQNCPVLEYLVINQTKYDNVMFEIRRPHWLYMTSLKSLHLLSVKFSSEESFASFLQICPVLEYLVINQPKYDNTIFKILPAWSQMRSLKSLHLFSVRFSGEESFASLLQNCPVLEYLVINQTKYDNVLFENLPLWFHMRSLKSLHLLSVKFSGDQSFTSLLQKCPVLEDLVINQTKYDNVLFENLPPLFHMQYLKSLHLLSVKFSGDKAVESLLKNCPVLEDLVINQTRDDNVMLININVPTLKRLSINNSKGKGVYVEEIHGFVIKTPSLMNLNFKDTFSNFVMFESMPQVTKANIQVICDPSDKFVGSLTSIKHLSLCCLTSKTPYPRGTIFLYLEHVELCTCSAGWSNLLACILNDSPKLRSLKLKSQHRAHYNDPMNWFDKPTNVPECLSTHLEIFEWRQYEGTEQEREVAAYILANATCLKMATFSTRCRNKYHRMLKKLKKLNRVSETCRLVFE